MSQSITEPGPALPAGSTVEPAPDLRLLSRGRILIGGAPFTITRLSSTGAALVGGWFAGREVSDSPQHQALARRLIRSGMAHPRSRSTAVPDLDRLGRLTVIIPVKDDQDGLNATLAALLSSESHDRLASIIVIDDGSSPPMQIAPEAAAHIDVELIRHRWPRGPGQARQAGLRLFKSSAPKSSSDLLNEPNRELVAFADAGVVVTAGDLARLIVTFDDPSVVAAAPRVESVEADHLVAKFDRVRSPLDLGPGQSLVGPGRHVPYVPSACLVVTADALEQAGHFDPALRYGEDVDLVWRLGAVGEVRYVPSVAVQHPPRPDLRAMINQRRSYGSAAGPLAARHGDVVAPARISPWSAMVFLLLFSGRPLAALGTVVGNALALKPKIEPLPDLTAEALVLTARGHWYGSLSILTASVRAWSPVLAISWLLVPSQRRRLAAVVVAAFARRLLDGPKRPTEAARDVALGAVDDLAYCAGVWEGVIRHRSAASLKAILPALMSWPNRRSDGDPSTQR